MRLINIYKTLNKKFGNSHWWPVISKNKRFEIILGAILTQNTSWGNVEKAIENLNKNNLISVEKIRKIDQKKLAKLIRSSGYYNQKAETLKLIAKFLSKNKNPTREQLLSLKRIGPETADSILLYAFNKPVFVIDVYTKRLFSRLGVCREDVSYSDLQDLFMKNLKKDAKIFNQYHALIVRQAKQFCKKKPVCEGCILKKSCKFK